MKKAFPSLFAVALALFLMPEFLGWLVILSRD